MNSNFYFTQQQKNFLRYLSGQEIKPVSDDRKCKNLREKYFSMDEESSQPEGSIWFDTRKIEGIAFVKNEFGNEKEDLINAYLEYYLFLSDLLENKLIKTMDLSEKNIVTAWWGKELGHQDKKNFI